jgi:signal transduction histidine kinase
MSQLEDKTYAGADSIFSIILASTVHDMKNSLGMMMSSLERLIDQEKQNINQTESTPNKQYSVVQYEYSRLNNLMIQLLALYKIENNQLPFNPSYHNLYDFIEEQVIAYTPLFEAKGFSYEINVDDELEAAFDETLMAMVISNIVGNTIRYARTKISVTVTTSPELSISISDDGPGYPEQMLALQGDYMHGIDNSTGSTGLGLFFAHKIAQLHKHANKTGYIALANGGNLGGGVFTITLP